MPGLLTLPTGRNMWRSKGRLNFPINGLVLYLPLWHPELNGSTIVSKDLNAYSCTVTGATWGATGRTFNTTLNGDNISIPHNAVFNFSKTSTFSLAAWIKTSQIGANTYGILAKYSTAPAGWFMAVNGGKLYCQLEKTGYKYTLTDDSIADGTWKFTVFTYDGSDTTAGMLSYVNGALAAVTPAQSGTVGNITTSVAVLIGSRVAQPSFGGLIGGSWIYNRVLAGAEILHMYNAT